MPKSCEDILSEMLRVALERRVLTSLAPYFEQLRECIEGGERNAPSSSATPLGRPLETVELTLRVSGSRDKEFRGRDLYIPNHIGEKLFPSKWRTPDKIRARVYLVEAGGRRYLIVEGEER